MRNIRANHLEDSLCRRLWATLPPPPVREPRPEMVVHGPKARRPNTHPVTKGSDDLILEVRRLREVEKMFPAQIRDHLRAMGIRLTKERITQIYQYQSRAHLVPHPQHGPYLKGETDAQRDNHQEGPWAVPPPGASEGFPAQTAG